MAISASNESSRAVKTSRRVVILGVSLLWAALTHAADNAETISYQRDVLPILQANCQGCHQPAKQGGEYMMTSHAALLTAGESGEQAVVAGDPDTSYLVELITPVGGHAEMPKDAPPLSESQIELIRKWIKQGALNDAPESGPGFSADNPPEYTRPPLITTVATSPDGKWLAVNGFSEVALVRSGDLSLARRLIGRSSRIESVAFSPDSKRLAVSGGSLGQFGEVQIWDVATGKLLLSKQVGYDVLVGAAWSPDGRLLAFGCTDNTLRAIDTATGEQKLHQGAHDDWLRDCVFTPDGKHLLSAARDMTVKLTEVATERFVDNVTSITPGALRGGVNALAMHPERSELLVGGADGVPKVYRVFRETERRIGDDANLVWRFPAQPGRVFAVAISQDGKWLAAASSLDGRSHVAVYPYNFDGKLPDDVRAAMAKRVSSRSAEDKKLIEAYVSSAPAAAWTTDIEADSIYALAFDAASENVLLGGASGYVMQLSVKDGKSLQRFTPFPLSEQTDTGAGEKQSLRVASGLDRIPEESASGTTASEFVALQVSPDEIRLQSEQDYVQCVVRAKDKSGSWHDVTRLATFESPENSGLDNSGLEISGEGLVRGQGRAGDFELRVKVAELTHTLPAKVELPDTSRPVDFLRDVNPILSRLGCNSGTCHGAQKGKAGFKLSLRGYDPLEDLRALSDDLESRRLNIAVPDASLMLLKPLGAIPHEGGVLLSKDSVYYEVLHRWIEEGAQLKRDTPKVTSIEVFPKNPVVQREGAWQQFRVEATFPDGTKRDVTREAFIESGNTEVATSHPTGLVQALRRGEAPMLARYEGAYAATTVTVMGDRAGFAWQQPAVNNRIDSLVASKWKRMKIQPSGLCTDAEFLRRVSLDLTGLPPTVEEVRGFLDDPAPTLEKRRRKIDELIGSAGYVEHWTNKWADLLQVNSKFLGGEGAKALREWIRRSVAENKPYDQFVRDILTASGSNKENPAASYFKILRDPDLMMENTTHLFLAVRFNCNKCHDHPFEKWTQDQYYELAAFFAQTKLSADPAAKNKKIGGTAVEGAKPLYEIISDADSGEIAHVRTGADVPPAFPYQSEFESKENATRRERLAAWMTSPDNEYFARSYVNRLWGYLTGTGLIEPLDDIRAGNPPSNPELLDFLTNYFIESGFDSEAVVREICNSRTYQLSVATNAWNRLDSQNYSHAKARRLPAEVLYDALHHVTGSVSEIPGVEPGTRAAALPDVAIQLPDGFLNNLGRPVRESACECERSDDLQLGPIMALVSGPTVGTAISDPDCALPTLAEEKDSTAEMVRELYLRILSREATDDEVAAVVQAESLIASDHDRLVAELEEKESWWSEEKQKREHDRKQGLAETQQAIEARSAEIAQQRAEAEEKRKAGLVVAEKALTEYAASSLDLANKYLAKNGSDVEWFPLAARSASSSNKAALLPQADRAIVASGNADKAVYTLTYETSLSALGAIRLEALPSPDVKGGGPGLPANGNFVVTEIELRVAPKDKPSEKTRVVLVGAKADFSQGGFDPKQAIDGNTGNQKGWAISPRGGTTHWAVWSAKEAMELSGPSILTVTIHQKHNAADHRLARFRISASKQAGEVPLGLAEEFSALAAVPEKQRTDENVSGLVSYLEKSDGRWQELKQKVAKLKKPLPEDAQIVKLKKRLKVLGTETPDDPALVELRSDVAASKNQMENQRLTLAQDLAWALINSPAFLFNR